MKTVNKIVNLTENEVNILTLLVTKGTGSGGERISTDIEESNMFQLYDVYPQALSEYGKSKSSVNGTLANLEKKGYITCYAGDGYFDGELTEKGIWWWSTATIDKVNKSQITKSTNMENSNKDSAMDARIVKMNAILSTKLSAISKNKREDLKAQKSSCRFILDEWDNEDNLSNFASDKDIFENQYELYCIAKSRIDQLQAIKHREERKKICFKELSEFNDNPADLSKDVKQCWAILHGYYDTDSVMQAILKEDDLFASAMEYRKKMIADAVRGLKVKKSVKATSEHKEAASKQQKQTKHNVGDLHPNGKWVWTEYKEGKFDWRGIPKDGKVVNAQEKKSKPKTNKVAKTMVEKKSEDKKIWTMKDFEERCGKGAGQGLTKTQKEAKKYLLRGYKIELTEVDGKFQNSCFLKKEGETPKSSFRDSIDGLFRKVGMEVPEELYMPRNSK